MEFTLFDFSNMLGSVDDVISATHTRSKLYITRLLNNSSGKNVEENSHHDSNLLEFAMLNLKCLRVNNPTTFSTRPHNLRRGRVRFAVTDSVSTLSNNLVETIASRADTVHKRFVCDGCVGGVSPPDLFNIGHPDPSTMPCVPPL
jgi:hypothetical protein